MRQGSAAHIDALSRNDGASPTRRAIAPAHLIAARLRSLPEYGGNRFPLRDPNHIGVKTGKSTKTGLHT